MVLKLLHIDESISSSKTKFEKVMIERIDPDCYHISGICIMDGYLEVVKRDSSAYIRQTGSALSLVVFMTLQEGNDITTGSVHC